MEPPKPPVKRTQAKDQIKLDADGTWYHGDFPVLHDRTVSFLNKNILLDEEGRYYLTGEEKPIYFIVEDTAFWVNKAERTIAGYLITLSDETIELLNPETLWYGRGGAIYCLIKGSRIPCKFSRKVQADLANDLVMEGGKFFLNFGKKQYPITNKAPKIDLRTPKELRKKNIRSKPVPPPRKAAKKKPVHAAPKKVAAKKPAKKPVKKAAKKSVAKKPAKKAKK